MTASWPRHHATRHAKCRPHNVEIIFARKIRRDTKGVFRTAIDRRDNGVLVNVFYKHSRIKQYLKDRRAMRIETVVNAPRDLGCNACLPNLDELQAKARACNRRILEAERAGQGTVLASPAFERIARPSTDAEGRRTPALRFGDPRVMALAGALCQTLLAATGFTNKNLRVLTAGLLGSAYTPGQMTYAGRVLSAHPAVPGHVPGRACRTAHAQHRHAHRWPGPASGDLVSGLISGPGPRRPAHANQQANHTEDSHMDVAR